MNVLIVEENPALGALWENHLCKQGGKVTLAESEDRALAILHDFEPDVIVADLDLPGSSAMAVADYAAYRYPAARVIFVTASTFFSDGSIFAMSPNACAFLPTRTPPEDLAALVEFHGRREGA
ncbi:MAG: response regulator [Maritimibacter sp.]